MTKRAVDQTVQRVRQLASLPYSAYAPGNVRWYPTKPDAFGQQWHQTKVRELFIFSHQIDRKGTLEFKVLNPANGHWLHFVPKGYIPGHEQFDAVASATGEFGKRTETATMYTATTLATGGLGGAAGLTGMGVRAFMGRFAVDSSIQFAGGLMAHNLNLRGAFEEINLTSSFLAAALPGGRIWGSVRNNALAALAEIKPLYAERRLKIEFAEFSTLSGALNYIQKVGFGVTADFLTGKMSAMVAPTRRSSVFAMRRATDPNIRWINAQRVQILGLYNHVVEASKFVGEGLSNMVEDQLKPSKPDDANK